MGKKVCIICHKELGAENAAKVKEDFFIESIRNLKRFLGVAQLNELYVCEPDIQKHAEKRRRFERNAVIGSTIVALFVLATIGLPILSGRFDILGFFSSILVGIVIILLIALFMYVPAIDPLRQVAAQEIKKPANISRSVRTSFSSLEVSKTSRKTAKKGE